MNDLRLLVIQARIGNLDAFGALVRRFQNMAVGYAFSLLGDFHLAEDVAQEAFIEAHDKLGQLREPAAFAGWFRRVVYKHCDRQRRGTSLPTAPLESNALTVADTASTPEEAIQHGETAHQVQLAIDLLPKAQQTAVVLYYMGDLNQQQIAAFLAVPVATVRYRLQAARKRLKEELLTMLEENLTDQRPSRDEAFVSRVIEGVKSLGWGRDRECTFAGALEAALAATDTPYPYRTLMGSTGLAFRTRWYQGDGGPGWCASSPVGEFPPHIEAAARAIGRSLSVENMLGQAQPNLHRLIPQIVSSIDAGRPVLAYEPKFNLDVIYGYDDNGEKLYLKDYFSGDKPLVLSIDELGPFFIFLGPAETPLTPGDALHQGLSIAVEHWNREPAHVCPGPQANGNGKQGHYWYGHAAFDRWINDLGRVDELDAEARNLLFFVSWWTFDCLLVDLRLPI
ncbi:MAG: sigma-70 family RNA polymerase sigma factor [Candidatus Latescibacteria bacterium]|nr:sigma-70 family RNA polymerase sigma factor [Candidatus Latescibacterota bacterium]